MYWLAEPDEDFDGDEFRQWPFMSPTPPRAQWLGSSSDVCQWRPTLNPRSRTSRTRSLATVRPAIQALTYTYFRWEHWPASGNVVYYREYVPPSELVRVRRWIRRYRHEAAQRRGVLIELRRLVASEVRRSSWMWDERLDW